MYRSGIALVGENCSELFTYLGKARQNLTAGQRAVGIAGGLATAVMTVTGAAAKPIGLVGTSIAALLAGSEIYGEAYLFSPEVASVQKIVTEAQRAFLIESDRLVTGWPANQTELFSRAHGLVRDYQQLCEVHSIRHLVNEAVANGRLTASAPLQDDFALRVDVQLRRSIARRLGLPAGRLTDNVLAGIYWKLTDSPTPVDDAELASKFLNGVTNSRGKSLADILDDPNDNKVEAVIGTIEQMRPQARTRIEETIKAIRAGTTPSAGNRRIDPASSKIKVTVLQNNQ